MPIRVAASLGVVVLCLVSGCSAGESSPGEPSSSHVNATALGSPSSSQCPPRLPIGLDPGAHGFGVEKAADELPSLPEPEEAWLCEYTPTKIGRTNKGTVFSWDRRGDAQTVDEARLRAITNALSGLTLIDETRGCTDDLGPRWMLVYSHGYDLVGLLIDDYGCGDIRLTDQPFTTPPGEADSGGIVPGVLTSDGELLSLVMANGQV